MTVLRASGPVSRREGMASGERLCRILANLPELTGVFMLGLSVAVAVSLLLRIHRPATAGLLGVVVGVLLAALLVRRLPARSSDVVPNLVATGLVSLLVVPSLALPGETILVERDPGFYTLLSRWLSTHESPRINIPTDAFPDTAGLNAAAAGFYEEGTEWFVQGNHLVPGLVALLGPIDSRLDLGGTLLLGGNVLLGGVGLLLVYGFARHVVGAWWGLLPMALLGLSMPWQYFTRSIYTEPLTAGFAFAAASFVVLAARSRNRVFYAIAGSLAGASALARIDGALVPILLLPLIAVIASAPASASARRVGDVAAFGVPAFAFVVVGFLDLAIHAPVYLSDLGGQWRDVAMLGAGSVASTGVVLWAGGSQRIRRWIIARQKALAGWAASVTGAVLVVLVLRPIFWQARLLDPDGPASTSLARLQEAEGMIPDAARSFDELSVSWMAWYLGWGFVVVAVGGFAWSSWSAVRRRDWGSAVLVALGMGMSVLYLSRISITPDQIWAMRRLLPVILPSFAVAAAVLLRQLMLSRWPGKGLSALGIMILLAVPVWVSRPLYPVPEYGGQLAEVEKLCAAVAGGRVLVPDPSLSVRMIVSLTTWCDTPALGISDPNPSVLAESSNASPAPLYVLSESPGLVAWEVADPAPFSSAFVERWERRLLGPPARTVLREWQLWLGLVGEDGLVRPVEPPAQSGLVPRPGTAGR